MILTALDKTEGLIEVKQTTEKYVLFPFPRGARQKESEKVSFILHM